MTRCGSGFRQLLLRCSSTVYPCTYSLTSSLIVLLAFLFFFISAPVNAAVPLKIDGSTGVKPLVQALVGAYQQRRTDVTVETGAGLNPQARIAALRSGHINIAMASHGIDIQQVSKHGLTAHRIAKMAVVMAVNGGVKINNISHQQICDIYTGRADNWQQLSPDTIPVDMPIKAFIRPFNEVDAEVFQQQIDCFAQLQLADSVITINKSGPMARSIANTAGAIGMTTMVRVAQSQGKMKAIAINGIAANEANLLSGEYRYSRDSFLITATEPSPEVAAFLAFIRSEQGADIIVENNAVPAE